MWWHQASYELGGGTNGLLSLGGGNCGVTALGWPALIICFTVTIFLIMTCYQLHATFSGSK